LLVQTLAQAATGLDLQDDDEVTVDVSIGPIQEAHSGEPSGSESPDDVSAVPSTTPAPSGSETGPTSSVRTGGTSGRATDTRTGGAGDDSLDFTGGSAGGVILIALFALLAGTGLIAFARGKRRSG
jgi:hypothetical protein